MELIGEVLGVDFILFDESLEVTGATVSNLSHFSLGLWGMAKV